MLCSLVVRVAYICWWGSCHHAKLQKLQSRDAGCVRVWLCGSSWQQQHWSRESFREVRSSLAVISFVFSFTWVQELSKGSCCASVIGFAVLPSHQTWPPQARTWQWCLWQMRVWQTAALTQHTRLCPCWTVSLWFNKVSVLVSYYPSNFTPIFSTWVKRK